MNAANFIREVKAAVSGRWPKRKKAGRRKTCKTPEEIYKEEMKKYQVDLPKTI